MARAGAAGRDDSARRGRNDAAQARGPGTRRGQTRQGLRVAFTSFDFPEAIATLTSLRRAQNVAAIPKPVAWP